MHFGAMADPNETISVWSRSRSPAASDDQYMRASIIKALPGGRRPKERSQDTHAMRFLSVRWYRC